MTSAAKEKLYRELVKSMQDEANKKIFEKALAIFAILENVKFPKGTRLRSAGGAIEVHSPETPVYEIRLKD